MLSPPHPTPGNSGDASLASGQPNTTIIPCDGGSVLGGKHPESPEWHAISVAELLGGSKQPRECHGSALSDIPLYYTRVYGDDATRAFDTTRRNFNVCNGANGAESLMAGDSAIPGASPCQPFSERRAQKAMCGKLDDELTDEVRALQAERALFDADERISPSIDDVTCSFCVPAVPQTRSRSAVTVTTSHNSDDHGGPSVAKFLPRQPVASLQFARDGSEFPLEEAVNLTSTTDIAKSVDEVKRIQMLLDSRIGVGGDVAAKQRIVALIRLLTTPDAIAGLETRLRAVRLLSVAVRMQQGRDTLLKLGQAVLEAVLRLVEDPRFTRIASGTTEAARKLLMAARGEAWILIALRQGPDDACWHGLATLSNLVNHSPARAAAVLGHQGLFRSLERHLVHGVQKALASKSGSAELCEYLGAFHLIVDIFTACNIHMRLPWNRKDSAWARGHDPSLFSNTKDSNVGLTERSSWEELITPDGERCWCRIGRDGIPVISQDQPSSPSKLPTSWTQQAVPAAVEADLRRFLTEIRRSPVVPRACAELITADGLSFVATEPVHELVMHLVLHEYELAHEWTGTCMPEPSVFAPESIGSVGAVGWLKRMWSRRKPIGRDFVSEVRGRHERCMMHAHKTHSGTKAAQFWNPMTIAEASTVKDMLLQEGMMLDTLVSYLDVVALLRDEQTEMYKRLRTGGPESSDSDVKALLNEIPLPADYDDAESTDY